MVLSQLARAAAFFCSALARPKYCSPPQILVLHNYIGSKKYMFTQSVGGVGHQKLIVDFSAAVTQCFCTEIRILFTLVFLSTLDCLIVITDQRL